MAINFKARKCKQGNDILLYIKSMHGLEYQAAHNKHMEMTYKIVEYKGPEYLMKINISADLYPYLF